MEAAQKFILPSHPDYQPPDTGSKILGAATRAQVLDGVQDKAPLQNVHMTDNHPLR